MKLQTDYAEVCECDSPDEIEYRISTDPQFCAWLLERTLHEARCVSAKLGSRRDYLYLTRMPEARLR